MFQVLGHLVSKYWPACIVVWIAILTFILCIAPDFKTVTKDGEFKFLPDNLPSREGEALFRKAFSGDLEKSNIIIVARKETEKGFTPDDRDFIFPASSGEPLFRKVTSADGVKKSVFIIVARRKGKKEFTQGDKDFILNSLKPELEKMVQAKKEEEKDCVLTSNIRTFDDSEIGASLVRQDDQAILIILEIIRKFPKGEKHSVIENSEKNKPLVDNLKKLLSTKRNDCNPSVAKFKLPDGLKLSFYNSLMPELENIANENKDLISNIRTFNDRGVGKLLLSEDNQATLIILELTSEYREKKNQPIIENIQQLLGVKGRGHRPSEAILKLPVGLDFSISGSATVGRDMRAAAEESAAKIDWVTIVLVFILLLVIYRAPLPVFIPLVTVFISTKIALGFLSILADHEVLGLFSSAKIYVTVILYGAGVDYCMFLIARYKEELDKGTSVEEAISLSVEKVGPALVASAGTTMAGIGMMMFAQFGKFQQAGLAMSMSLFFVLCTSLTFAPAFLRLSGKWAFWPRIHSENISKTGGWVSQTSFISKVIQSRKFQQLWDEIGRRLTAKPGKIWTVCVLCMLPFAINGLMNFGYLSFGLLSELPSEGNSAAVSVEGTNAVQEHFPAGTTGPVTILWHIPDYNFRDDEPVVELSDRLEAMKDELNIANILSSANPLGITKRGREAANQPIPIAKRGIRLRRIQQHYLSQQKGYDGSVARMDVIFTEDPFSRNSIQHFKNLKMTVARILPEIVKSIERFDEKGDAVENPPEDLNYEVHYIGSTPSITDLKTITNADQIRIDILVLVSVFLILLALIRRPAISAYLILSVFFSFLVTLGATYCVFWVLDTEGFSGLDWKVPMFLFTILIAVGEDYNIYLFTRIEEEQKNHGSLKGITEALSKTGGIISSCGLIMAGTFSSLMTGSLAGMQQLGFALAFGVLLDTFVVRPILVPAYLILLHSGRFGKLGRWMGDSTK